MAIRDYAFPLQSPRGPGEAFTLAWFTIALCSGLAGRGRRRRRRSVNCMQSKLPRVQGRLLGNWGFQLPVGRNRPDQTVNPRIANPQAS